MEECSVHPPIGPKECPMQLLKSQRNGGLRHIPEVSDRWAPYYHMGKFTT